jgi:nucleotide-binding universal stress UspA family protein
MQNGAELHMVSIKKPGHATILIEDTKRKTAYQRACKMAEESGVELHTHIVARHPVQSIVNLAAELNAELLVMGEKGHSSWYQRLLGSRAERIKELAPCPVLLVK